MKILIRFRKLFISSEESIQWFISNILLPYKRAYHSEEQPKLKRKDLVRHFNQINKINKMFNLYRYIFNKNNLSQDILLLTYMFY